MYETIASNAGLTPHLAASLAGEDMRQRADQALRRLEDADADAGHWRDAAFALACIGQAEMAMRLLQEALRQARCYALPCAQTPRLRLLMLLAVGDLAANAPLECLLAGSAVAITQVYVDLSPLRAQDLPEHDLLFIAVAHAPAHRELLQHLQQQLVAWPRPVLDQAEALLALDRVEVAQRLQGIAGLWVPVTRLLTRQQVIEEALALPAIIRPEGSQAGLGLDCLSEAAQLPAYLEQHVAPNYTLAPFVDYRRPDGLYAKMRLALIDGRAWPCHYALSAHWMVHYVNAGMYEDADKRTAEEAFMADFEAWSRPHAATFAMISERLQLAYVLIDAAELTDGRILLFEADHAMVVHALDDAQRFPYKQVQMGRVREAMLACLLRHAGGGHGLS